MYNFATTNISFATWCKKNEFLGLCYILSTIHEYVLFHVQPGIVFYLAFYVQFLKKAQKKKDAAEI